MHARADYPKSTTNRFRFSGKERIDDLFGLDTETQYDFGARTYDSNVGRWWSVDPMAEKYYSHSPYNYCLNNPVKYIDPDGADIYNYDIARYLDKTSYFGQGNINFDMTQKIGGFEVSPYLNKDGDIIGWSAFRNGHIQYVMDKASDIRVFKDNVSVFALAADLFYRYGFPGEGVIEVLAGNRVKGLGSLWKQALNTPEFYFGVAMTVVSAYQIAKPTGAVKANYIRFIDKMPANAKSSATWQLQRGGNYIFEATSPAKNIPGSNAVYTKWVDPLGQTYKMNKTTYAPDGSVVHIKPK